MNRLEAFFIPVKIERVRELTGVYFRMGESRPEIRVFAHISTPARTEAEPVQYALLAQAPQNGMAELGRIDPDTRDFTEFDPSGIRFALYRRSPNRVIDQIMVLPDQLRMLQTLAELDAIQGIQIEREMIPSR